MSRESVTRVNYFNQPLKSDIFNCAYWHCAFYNTVGCCIRDITVSFQFL